MTTRTLTGPSARVIGSLLLRVPADACRSSDVTARVCRVTLRAGHTLERVLSVGGAEATTATAEGRRTWRLALPLAPWQVEDLEAALRVVGGG